MTNPFDFPMPFWLIYLYLGGFYTFVDAMLFTGMLRTLWKNRIRSKAPLPSPLPSVSILICARNEETDLGPCLDSALKQDYPGTWDIWVADDRSTDSTPQILARYQSEHPGRIHALRIDETPQGRSPKKHALTLLAAKVQGEIFALTDADCILPSTWLSALIRQFTPDTEWVSAYSWFETPGASPLLAGTQALDFLTHRTVDASAVGLGQPITSCGQNMAYRKSTFEDLKGFEGVFHMTSGDDDLLLHKLARVRRHAIHYCTDPKAHVKSLGKATWKGALEQRKRWASKTPHYKPSSVFFLGSVFAFYMMILIMIPVGLVIWLVQGSSVVLQAGVVAFLWKTFWDTVALSGGWIAFGTRGTWKWLIPTALMHIPVIVAAVLGGVLGSFTWKDNATGRKEKSLYN